MPNDPADLLGIYRDLDDVPDRHRLRAFADTYEKRDTWGEWYEQCVLPECNSKTGREEAIRHEERWKKHMDTRRHHALATPADVDAYSANLFVRNSGSGVARYFRRVASFYDYLVGSTEHPHVYSPVLIAASGDGPAAKAWRCER